MNTVNKLVGMLSLSLLATGAYADRSAEQAYLATARQDVGVPVPVHVVSPDGYGLRHGDLALLSFTIDAGGVPRDISVDSTTDPRLAARAVVAVAQWRFTPVVVEGQAVATKVRLPVRAVNPEYTRMAYAAK